MAKREFKSSWWSIELFPGWRAEQDDSCTTISEDRGVGALQISVYEHEGQPVSAKDLYELSKGEYPADAKVNEGLFGQFKGLCVSFSANEKYWCKWWLANHSLLLFVTYNCDVADRNREIERIDQMIATLKVNEWGSKR